MTFTVQHDVVQLQIPVMGGDDDDDDDNDTGGDDDAFSWWVSKHGIDTISTLSQQILILD